MFLGRYRQGEPVVLTLLSHDDDGEAAPPDGPPAVTVYDDAGAKVASGAVPLLDRYRQPGWCGYRLRLGALGVGHYGVTFGYSGGGSARLDAATFEVVAGGHADGAVLAMTHYERPHAAFLVHQAESGTRVFGRNPWV